MAGGNAPCPNCGGMMDLLRTSRQHAQSREIELKWAICTSCHHVRLDHWSFCDAEEYLDRASTVRKTG